jgi:hypothetical protein
MKLIPTLVVAAGLFSALPASAAPITLNFEDQTSFASLVIPADYGFSANGALLALTNDGTGPGLSGEYFSNNPSGNSVMFGFGPLPGEYAALVSTVGFQNSVSFSYSADAAGTIYARDAAGAILGSVLLAANTTGEGSDHPFSTWATSLLTFSGIATYIDFTELANGHAAFDDVTVNPVPLPAGALLLPFGLAALRLASRKRKEA